MMNALAGPVTSIATSIIANFSPAKSPFYGVVTFGTVALCLAAAGFDRKPWLALAIPVYAVIVTCVWLATQSRPELGEEEAENQLKFARSLSLSSGLLALVFTARMSVDNDLAFWISYGACMAQVVIFLTYMWARSKSKEKHVNFNFVQFTLITTALLGGASYCNTQYAMNFVPEVMGGGESAERYFVAGAGLYSLWLVCLLRWIRHVRKLIMIPGDGGGDT